MECSVCGISGQLRNVSEALSSKGIVLVCDKCAMQEGFPRLKKIKITKEPERETMYQRMARLAGVKPKEPERPWARVQEKSLRDIVNKNYEEKVKSQGLILKPRPDLVDNFHWIIMRVRRVKGLTHKQLADRIEEPEAAIKMAEQGVVPEGYKLVDKLERFLRVRLIRERAIMPQIQQVQQIHQTQKQEKTLVFDKQVLGSLTVADLKRIKQEKEKALEELKASNEAKNFDEDNAEAEEENSDSQARNYNRLDYE